MVLSFATIGSNVLVIHHSPKLVFVALLMASCSTRISFAFRATHFQPSTLTTTTTQLFRERQSWFAELPRRAPRSSFSTARRAFSSSTTEDDDHNSYFDVIVVGGGHAGCEAATAAARTGAKVALVSQRLDTIGELSCNPSIGGIGKGHLVREIDALQGVMGVTADAAGIHYRVLNRRKGPAVRGPRAQMDRDYYKSAMQTTLSDISLYPNLHRIEGSVHDLLLDESAHSTLDSLAPLSAATTPNNGLLGARSTTTDDPQVQRMQEAATTAVMNERKARIAGVVVNVPVSLEASSSDTNETTAATETSTQKTRRMEIQARAVVITTGTFLRGVLMVGHDRYAGGRHLRDSECVEPPSTGLAETLQRFQFPLSRLKTGTPARIDGRTIDWAACAIQPSDRPAQAFSHLLQFRDEQPTCFQNNQVIDCYQTATNEETHKLVLEYEHLLPIYDGLDGKGNGPRYCPSIYKKVQRFPDRLGHNCFLEPEGINTDIVYPNGMSGPYPPEIQQKILRTMKGMGAVEIVRPGYDVEYDFVNPICLTHTLETKRIGGLYLAGQICGTTGYEEAGAQGIVAGANAGRAAAAAACNEAAPVPFVIGRDEGYIGVLIDDLVTRGTMEPYRMFTSRAEYRITLRADNADLRMTRKGIEFGLVHDEERMAALDAREFLIDDRVQQLRQFDMKVTEWAARGGNDLMGGAQLMQKIGQKKTAEDVLSMPHVTLKDVEDIILAVQEEERAKIAQTAASMTSEHDDEHDGDIWKEPQPRWLQTPSPPAIYDTVEASVKYQSYVRRQNKDMDSWRRAQGLRIPPDVQYNRANLPTLSLEELEKLNAVRPTTFAEASQISGVTPQSLVYLYHNIMRRNKRRETSAVA